MSLDTIQPIYFSTEHDLDKEVFFPILNHSHSVDCMSGYFSSNILIELAYSLSNFLRSKNANLKFIVSPNFSSQDIALLKKAFDTNSNMLSIIFDNNDLTYENLRTKTIEVLSFLIFTKKLELKIAISESGLFHTKCWICNTNQGKVIIHGSMNATAMGVSQNFEQISISKSWSGDEGLSVANKISNRFNRIWNDQYAGINVFDVNNETLLELEKYFSKNKNIDLLNIELLEQLQLVKYSNKRLLTPSWLNYKTGDFSHQGKAIDAWINNDGRGILSIATGGGKTLTSLIAASIINKKENKLLLVIAVPTITLTEQWKSDVVKFSVKPLNISNIKTSEVGTEINSRIRNLKMGITNIEAIIITHDALKSERINRLMSKASQFVSLMLIGDEVHNLGSIGFQEVAPSYYQYKLGLSATFERQFDAIGTKFLTDYFGEVVFEYGLRDAIGACLVSFDYHIHKIYLNAEEEYDWLELTGAIKKLSYAANFDDGNSDKERWKLLCLKRRRIVESASGKILKLKEIMPKDNKSIKRTLIFCTDKYPEQLNQVNAYLKDRGVSFHQITAEETSKKKLLEQVVSAFHNDGLQVLTSKRVLDEGFNIPQTEIAYLLSSNTVKRQWVQRLGRVLRKSDATKKEKAIIHDFFVSPASFEKNLDEDLISLLIGEYERINFFNSLCLNSLGRNGSAYLLDEILDVIGERIK